LGTSSPEADVTRLAACPFLARLGTLILSGYDILPQVQRLLESPHLGRLTALDLSNNGLGDRDAWALAAWPQLTRLRALVLCHNHIGAEGAHALAMSPHLQQLQTLRLDGNPCLQPRAREALARSLERTFVPALLVLLLRMRCGEGTTPETPAASL